MKECRYYTKIEEGKDGGKSLKVRCELCPHRCVIPDGSMGYVEADGISRANCIPLFMASHVPWQMTLSRRSLSMSFIPAPDACPCHVRGVTFGVLTVRTMTFRKHCPLI